MLPLPVDTFPDRIVTARLALRRPAPSEAPDCGRRFNAARGVALSAELALRFGSFVIEHWARYGFGFLVMERPGDSSPMGHCGLKYTDAYPGHWPDDFEAIEVGYSLLPAFRREGYAMESARAVLAAAFAAFDVPSIRGRCDLNNLASAVVLARCGMTELEPDHQRHFILQRPLS
jgi:RimJ/RimL family protein N-acetyltransferase